MITLEIPPRFLGRMRDLLGDEYPAFTSIYSQPATHGLRVNTLKLTAKQFEAISPFSLTPLPWSPAGYQITDDNRPGKHPYHAAGMYYLQDPHAQAVAEILAPQPGEAVLDIAAAPGGKTTHLASRMQNQGLLVANEIKTKRIGHLAANLERWGAHNVVILNETPERLVAIFGSFFDRVLVDAPCSGEGMFRKDPAAIQGWSEEVIQGCAVRQKAILRLAARLVRARGWLCYSTCTFAPEENAGVVMDFLQGHPEFELASCTGNEPLGVELSGDKMVHLWPHRSAGEGHFVALMKRTTTGPVYLQPTHTQNRSRRFHNPLPRDIKHWYDAWCSDNLINELPVTPRQVGSRLYAVPEGLPDLSSIHILHPGWWLGNIKKDRFEPAHALAMGLGSADMRHILALPVEGSEVQKYLRGETLPGEGEDGWTLVAVSPQANPNQPIHDLPASFPLGWGKRVHNTLKNHFPRGLIWQ